MKKTVKKLYREMIEVRDYDVEKCIHNNEYFEIVYCEESMMLSPEELISKRRSTSKTFISKVGAKNYKLYGYDWNPVN
jgi:hypothetical protein